MRFGSPDSGGGGSPPSGITASVHAAESCISTSARSTRHPLPRDDALRDLAQRTAGGASNGVHSECKTCCEFRSRAGDSSRARRSPRSPRRLPTRCYSTAGSSMEQRSGARSHHRRRPARGRSSHPVAVRAPESISVDMNLMIAIVNVRAVGATAHTSAPRRPPVQLRRCGSSSSVQRCHDM